jgi:ABC-type sugar transport system permease subunit
VVFALLLQSRTGLVNAGLHSLFASWDPEFAWLDRHVMASLILATVWLYAGFNMIYFLAALQNVPREQIEAASIDGAKAWQRFRHVVLPEITPVAGFVVLLSIIGSFQLFELPWVMLISGNSEPDERGLTIVMYLYRTGFMTLDLGYACSIGWVLALVLMAIALGQRLLMRRGEEER